LPDKQDDYSAYIIERSRAQYASSREYVEKYVGERYLLKATSPRQSQQPRPLVSPVSQQAPRPAAPARNTAEAVIAAATAEHVAETKPAGIVLPQPDEQVVLSEQPTKPKRKRTRRRKKSAQIIDESTITLSHN
jgi:hypothetical protein